MLFPPVLNFLKLISINILKQPQAVNTGLDKPASNYDVATVVQYLDKKTLG